VPSRGTDFCKLCTHHDTFSKHSATDGYCQWSCTQVQRLVCTEAVGGGGGYSYEVDVREIVVRFRQGQECISSPKHPDQLRGPPSLLFDGYWGTSPRRLQLEREADHTSHLLPRLRISVAVPPLTHTHSWSAQGELYVVLLLLTNFMFCWPCISV